ncbi:MAG: SH3 domain-containing protein [Lachnospiraceae bacterium]|nr:SH3 domain-containing protein [Lachnospiraceae bacterium]
MNGNNMGKNFGRIMGFIMAMFVMGMAVCAADAEDITKNRVFQVNGDVELHEAPDSDSAITATLPGGTPVIVKEDVQGEWCMVAYREQMGYVQISFLSFVGSQNTSAITNDQTVSESEAQPEDQTMQIDEIHQKNEAVRNGGEAQPKDEVQSVERTIPDGDVQPDDKTITEIGADTLEDEFKRIQEQNLLAYQEAEAAKEQAKSDRIWGIVIAVLVAAIFVVGIVTTLAGNKGKKREQ